MMCPAQQQWQNLKHRTLRLIQRVKQSHAVMHHRYCTLRTMECEEDLKAALKHEEAAEAMMEKAFNTNN